MKITGIVIAVTGLAIEAVGAMAMASYPLPSRLPSPFTLFSLGGIAFVAGVIMAGIGSALASSTP